jgi:uncharacterized protein
MIFHSSFENIYLWLPLIGFTIGFFASMLGTGGGFFFLPALILFFSVPAQIAVATALAATLPICIVGSISHYRHKNIHLNLGLIFSIAGIIGAIAGAGFSNIVTSNQLKISFGIYSILIALHMIYNNRKVKKAAKTGIELPVDSKRKRITRGSVYGFLAGLVTGTFGTNGAAPILAGLFTMRIPIKLVAGTSLMVISITTVSALGAHFLVGRIDLTLVYFLTFGSVIGAFSGPKLLAGIKIGRAEVPIRNWYAWGLIVFGVLMIVVN